MMTKTIAILTLIAGLGLAARAVTVDAPKKTPVVIVEELGWYPVVEDVDCEYVVLPDSSTLIQGGESC